MTASKFGGQYLAKFFGGQPNHGHLVINIDPDMNGVGRAHLIIGDKPTIRTFDCDVFQGVGGDLSGRYVETSPRESSDDGKEPPPVEFEPKTFRISREGSFDLLHLENEQAADPIQLTNIDSLGSIAPLQIGSWTEFRKWADAAKSEDPGSIFRGVSLARHRLTTSFHRTGRVDLVRYHERDLHIFSEMAETIGDLKLSGDIGATLGFAQHHGFPTPLLDWTESPYIAAYFAHLGAIEDRRGAGGESVKIYKMRGDFVSRNCPKSVGMTDGFPRIWIFKPRSSGNKRLIYQQGIFTHSNIVNIESYLRSLELPNGPSILDVIEIPARLARESFLNLHNMGISHLTLFPGLDGAAKYSAHKCFA